MNDLQNAIKFLIISFDAEVAHLQTDKLCEEEVI